MKVEINGYEAVIPRFGYDEKTGLPKRVGSSEYCFQILKNLERIDKKNEYIIYLPTKETYDLPQESSRWSYKIVPRKTIWTLLDLAFAIFKKGRRPDIFFSPTHYLPAFIPCPSVISILDLSYIKYPQLFKKRDLYQLRAWTWFSQMRAKKIITISSSSKDDIMRFYKVPEEKIRVVYPGVKSEIRSTKFEANSKFKMQNSKVLKEKYGVECDYILFVGTLQPRKNIERFIEAFSYIVRGPVTGFPPASARVGRLNESQFSLRAVGIPSTRATPHSLSLIIIGKKGWMYEGIVSAPKKFGVEDRVKFLDFVPDKDLPAFYQNAICFVSPSLYEGFGLPVLEAMKYGCPVVTSNISSLPEAGGDAALYFDPYDIEDIASKIKKVIKDEKLREDMIKKGYAQVKKFSWEKAARETLEVLEEVQGEKKGSI